MLELTGERQFDCEAACKIFELKINPKYLNAFLRKKKKIESYRSVPFKVSDLGFI